MFLDLLYEASNDKLWHLFPSKKDKLDFSNAYSASSKNTSILMADSLNSSFESLKFSDH